MSPEAVSDELGTWKVPAVNRQQVAVLALAGLLAVFGAGYLLGGRAARDGRPRFEGVDDRLPPRGPGPGAPTGEGTLRRRP
jgi:hypothetical protein